jgi:hypothetical protein
MGRASTPSPSLLILDLSLRGGLKPDVAIPVSSWTLRGFGLLRKNTALAMTEFER